MNYSVNDIENAKARIEFIKAKIAELPPDRERNSPRELLKQGYVHPEILGGKTLVDILRSKPLHIENPVLSFTELTSLSTYFFLNSHKVCGREIPTTSFHFPLTIKGTKEDVVKAIDKTLKGNKKDSNLLEIEAEAEAEALLLIQEQQMKTKIGFLGGSGLAGLTGLGNTLAQEIKYNEGAVLQVLKKAKEQEDQNGKTLSFDEVLRLYNNGISQDEIKAWVWYKRSIGIPMTGWEKYFMESKDAQKGELLKTTKSTIIKDNHFRDLYTVPEGKILGKPTRFSNEYDKSNWLVFRDSEGLKYVKESDIKRINSAQSVSESKLKELVLVGALYYLNGELVPYPIYVFGNMYDRELSLIKDREFITGTYSNDVYENHLRAINEAKPRLLTITSPDPQERPIITAISDFASDTGYFAVDKIREEYLDIENVDEFKKVNGRIERKKAREHTNIKFEEGVKYSLQEVFVKWLYSLNQDEYFKKSDAVNIVDYYIFKKPLKDDKLSPSDKAEVKANARNEGEKLFQVFLHEVLTPEDQQKLDFTWNRLYNGESDVAHHRIPVGFECSATFKNNPLQIRPAQREGVAFMEAVGSGIIAYDVGVGKTMTAIIELANAIYQGKCSRPLIVVPKPTYDKWIGELVGYKDKKTDKFITGILSHTGVKINDWGNLGTDYIKKINFEKAVPEKSITIVTYEGMKRIGMSQKLMDEMLDELINILEQSKVGMTARDKGINYQKYYEMIGIGNKGTVCDIDTLKFDYLIIDEAHRCKNIFAGVKQDDDGNKRYDLQGATSETGQKAFFLANYIQRRYGKNVMLLTATPFTNSPLEIYSMLSLVGYNNLKKMGILNINDFFDLFVLPTIEYVVNYKEEITQKEVVKSFINRYLLSKLIYNHINFKTGEEANIKRPVKINLPRLYRNNNGISEKLGGEDQILTYLDMTPKQREQQVAIVAMAKAATMGGKPDFGAIFKALNRSLDNAFSPFLLKGSPEDYKEFVEASPKIHYAMECIRSVKKYHEEREEPVSGQIIYSNRGKEFFPYIKEYLIKEVGFKPSVKFGKYQVSEVEIISSDISDTKKENIVAAFLDGVVKIIIGTSTIREGIDLQRNGTVCYNLYPDWNPTDIRQLEGRIHRQGNNFGYVRFVMPLVQDSMDVFVFQKLEEKTSRINDIWFRGDRGNVLDVESLDPAEVKIALITDVDRIVRMLFDEEKDVLNREYRALLNKIKLIGEIKEDIEYYKSTFETVFKNLRTFKNTLENHSLWNEVRGTPEEIKADGPAQKEKQKQAKPLLDEINSYIESTDRSDKELIGIMRKIIAFAPKIQIYVGSYEYQLQYFKSYVSKVRKTERNILKPKGYTIESDLDKVLEDYRLEKTKMEESVKIYTHNQKGEKTEDNGTTRWKELVEEVHRKKSAMSVDGKSPKERAKDFAKLNYLLAYKASDVDQGVTDLPKQQKDSKQKYLLPAKYTPDTLPDDITLIEIEMEAEAEALILIQEQELELLTA